MQFIPYLDFDGSCHEAFAFYPAAFGGEPPQAMTYREAPEDLRPRMPADTLDHSVHTQISVGGGLLMGVDAPSHAACRGQRQRRGRCHGQFVEQAERVFAALSEGGTVDMPMEETLWAHRWGSLTDRYGKAWMFDCSKPDEYCR